MKFWKCSRTIEDHLNLFEFEFEFLAKFGRLWMFIYSAGSSVEQWGIIWETGGPVRNMDTPSYLNLSSDCIVRHWLDISSRNLKACYLVSLARLTNIYPRPFSHLLDTILGKIRVTRGHHLINQLINNHNGW